MDTLTSPNQHTDDRIKSLKAAGLGLSPMSPDWMKRIEEECDAIHAARHLEIGGTCAFTDDESLDDGCWIRYRIRREVLGYPRGWSFTEKRVRRE